MLLFIAFHEADLAYSTITSFSLIVLVLLIVYSLLVNMIIISST